jgi:hypothetical protein
MKTLTPADQKKYKAYQAKSRKTLIKKIPSECNMYYCNKTCKNTLFEAGKNKYPSLPKELTSNKKLKAFMTKINKQNKKVLFGDKDNVLKDGFYEKLGRVKVNKLKKNGATSGCVQMLPDDSPAL